MADLVAAILKAAGYDCEVSPEGTDQGIDLSTQRFAIKVWDSSDVLDKLFAYYRDLPADVRRDLPLKQVWTISVESE